MLKKIQEIEFMLQKQSLVLAPENFGLAHIGPKQFETWADQYVHHSELPLLRQGKFQKTKSLIDDEDVKSTCLYFVQFSSKNR